MKNQIIKNITSNYLVSFLGILIGFLLVPFLILKLGTEAYGLIALVDSTILFFEVATVGIRTALARHATYSLSSGKEEDYQTFLSTGRVVLLGSSFFVFSVGVVLCLFFPQIFKVPEHLITDSRLFVFFVVIAEAVTVPNIVFWSALYSKQRFDLINFALSFGTLTRASTLFILFSFLPKRYVSLGTYGFVYLLFTWVQNYMIYRNHKKVLPNLRIRFRYFRKEKIREILSFSAFTSLQRLSGMLVGNMTHILLNMFYGPAANALYSVATKLPMMMRRLFTEATWSLTPTFTDLAAKNDKIRFERLFIFYTKLLVTVTSPICLFLILFGKQLIVRWVGPDFLISGHLVGLYSAPLLFGIPFAVCGCISNAYGRVKVPSLVGIFYSIFNVISGIVLAQGLHMGIYGFAISNLFSAFTFLILFQPYYACKISGVSYWHYMNESIIRPFIPAIIIFGSLYLYFHNSPLPLKMPLLSIGLWLGAVLFVSYSANYFFSLSGVEKSLVNDIMLKALPRFKKVR